MGADPRSTGPDHREFHGAKLFLRCGDALLTYLRDDLAQIPFPAHWDLPGGGREGGESAKDCALRELFEEFGLVLPGERITGHVFPAHNAPGEMSWLFVGEITEAEIAAIRFGEEGQFWQMMSIAEFLTHPRGVPHFQDWVRTVL